MNYLASIRKQFTYYRLLGERTFAQLSEAELVWIPGEGTAGNSIATIVKHLHGNMLSRWTDFLTSDGEKAFRDRDGEFTGPPGDRDSLMNLWNEGWDLLESTLAGLTDDDLQRMVYIRNKGHSVMEAINRQLAHYAYHVGQIVLLGKMRKGESWRSLSIPKGGSRAYNADSFAKGQRREHYTDQWTQTK